jgi:hypothetical protein
MERSQSLEVVPEECTYPTSSDQYTILEQIGAGMGGNKIFKATVISGPNEKDVVAIKMIQMRPSEREEVTDKMGKEIRAMRSAAFRHICVFSLQYLD